MNQPVPLPVAFPSLNDTVTDHLGSEAAAGANIGFGFRLLQRLIEDQPVGNVFFSPFSVSSALAMTLNGADGQTEHDIARALGLKNMTRDEANRLYGMLLASLTADLDVKVRIANALWGRHGLTFAADFQERCRLFYAAAAESLDFSSSDAVAAINDWASGNTDGKITQLVTQTDITHAAVVLTNAIYFEGLWQTEFREADTKPAPFAAPDGPVTVPMMRQTGSFPYAETASGRIVSLPYGNGRMSLVVLLPNIEEKIETLVQSLDAKGWAAQISEMKPMRLTLFLPRFKAEYEGRLRVPLSALGMASAFERHADFRPMGTGALMIGEVIHKAVLDVEEKGTVAAAATAVVMMRSAALRPAPVLRVDRPFFLAIRDSLTGTILFAGMIRDPQQDGVGYMS